MQKLDIKAFAIAAGISWGIYMLFLGWIAVDGYAAGIVHIIGSAYIGFKPGFVGGIIGGIFGFFDGAVGGAIIALIYNSLLKKK
ncbi:membrane-associated protein [Patescibacteria group bacterium]|nr:membrane-associated protein [Patescibacteria group bacterium]